MYFTYILRCADDTLYVGTTNDLEKRLKDHNESKRGARYTKARRPVEMVYHEEFASKSEALSREHKIKSWPREKKLALIRGPVFNSSRPHPQKRYTVYMQRQEFKVNGEDLVRTVKELIKAGNARRIIIKNEEGKSLVEFPLTVGAVGAILLPTLAAIGAVAALVTKCTIVVEKTDDQSDTQA